MNLFLWFLNWCVSVSKGLYWRISAKSNMGAGLVTALHSVTEIPQLAKDLLVPGQGQGISSSEMQRSGVRPYIFRLRIPRIFLLEDSPEFFSAMTGLALQTSDGITYDRSNPLSGIELFSEVLFLPEWMVQVTEEKQSGIGFRFKALPPEGASPIGQTEGSTGGIDLTRDKIGLQVQSARQSV